MCNSGKSNRLNLYLTERDTNIQIIVQSHQNKTQQALYPPKYMFLISFWFLICFFIQLHAPISIIYSRRKYYCYHQNTKYLWCNPIIHFSNIAIAILYFSLLLLVKLLLLILFASFWYKFFAWKSWKSDNYMESNTEKKPWTNLQNSYKNLSKKIKSDNFCYRKVGRAITKWGSNREKSNIAIAILEKLPSIKGNKNYFTFWW